MRQHHYQLSVVWTGNKGEGTKSYRAYDRSYDVEVEGKPTVLGSADPSFLGDPSRYNPEEMLVAALSSCHMLSYLHLCSANKIVVLEYRDDAEGTMTQNPDGSGEFSEVLLKPMVVIADGSDAEKALALHEDAHHLCFIARSVNFPVRHEGKVSVSG